MLKDTMLFLARQDSIRRFVSSNPAARRVARRFTAGETIDEALEVVQALNRKHISVSLDHLGENVSEESEAEDTARGYIQILDRIQASGVEANISIKLTALGLDISEELCNQNLTCVLRHARDLHNFVRVDMEGSNYTQRTLDLVLNLRCEFDQVGTVMQSMLYRTPKDVAKLMESSTRVRLVKGAYLEPASVAYPKKADVDAAYIQLMHALLLQGVYPAIATHDEHIIADACNFAEQRGISPARFEFQMLYGIRRDLQERLAGDGYNVRVYVPYGTQWYPYLTRRLAERPANLIFVLSNVIRR
jgi:proline dehydrogenase